MPEQAKHRVSASMIPRYIGELVTVVGATHGNNGINTDTMQIETCDKQMVTVHFTQLLTEPLTAFVEVLAYVEPDCSLKAMRVVNFGDNFDLDTYGQVIELLPNFPSLIAIA